MALSRRGNRRRSILVLLVVTSVTLITLDERGQGSGVIGSARDAARDALAPVQTAVDDVFSPVGDWWDGITRAGSLKSENARLRRRLAEERGRVSTAKEALTENEELKKLAQVPFVPGIPVITAEVVAGSPGNFELTAEISKGASSGVAAGMPVVAGEGLVGKVNDASRRRATVLLLTDPSSAVGVRLEKSNVPGVAKGQTGSNLLRLDFIDSSVPVAKGELVFTAGLQDAVFPAGIPVAKVVSVKKEPGDLTQSILLQPLVDVSRIEFVKVLRWPVASGG